VKISIFADARRVGLAEPVAQSFADYASGASPIAPQPGADGASAVAKAMAGQGAPSTQIKTLPAGLEA